ncbi:MAG: bifunctional glycosyltransferase family 2/GtrA family protein [Tissierellia bacterium]|nr:bifunctional glycosyltransferase family 2/GtrA family protein [Tissierellia bacterium]
MSSLKFAPEDLVLIPAYEPDEAMLHFLGELREAGARVLVVNDGSSPEKEAIFAAARGLTTVTGYEENRGKGHALKWGYRYILDELPKASYIVCADCDGQHSLEDTHRTLQACKAQGGGLTLGVRTFAKGSTPWRSRLGNFLSALLFSILTGVGGIYDTQTGLRAFHRSHLPFFLKIGGDRYDYEMLALKEWLLVHGGLEQVPIETIYRDMDNSNSHYRSLVDSVRILKILFTHGQAILYTLVAILSFALDFALFLTFHFLLAPLPRGRLLLSNLISRLFSATVNFLLNRNLVFDSQDRLWKDVLEYGGLVLLVLFLNSLLLQGYAALGLDAPYAKALTEGTIFIFSYFAQKLVVFRKA